LHGFWSVEKLKNHNYRNKRSITFENVKETKFIIVILYKVGA